MHKDSRKQHKEKYTKSRTARVTPDQSRRCRIMIELLI